MSWEQISTAITFYFFYTESKVGKTGLTVTVDVYRAGAEIVTAAVATEVGDGFYKYELASGSVTVEGEYVAVAKTTTTTVDQQHIPALWIVGRAGVENLDATVSSRASQTSLDTLDDYVDTEMASVLAAVDTEVAAIKTKTDNLPAAPAATGDIPSAASIADAVWDEATAGHVAAGSTGEALTAVDADSSGVTTLLARLTATRAGLMDNLDAAITTRLATAGYTAPDNASITSILAAVDTEIRGGR